MPDIEQSTAIVDSPIMREPAPLIDHPTSGIFYTLGIISLGECLSLAYGLHVHKALIFVCLAAMLCAIGLTWRARDGFACLTRSLLATGIVLGFCRLPVIGTFLHQPQMRGQLFPFVLLASLAAMLCAVILLSSRPRLRAICFWVCLLTFWIMGIWYLRFTPNPHIDVYIFQRDGCKALASGQNPYSMRVPNMYSAELHFYPPGSVVDGLIQFGYFYPPLSLLLDLPGYFAGDIRYSLLTALVFAALLLGYARPGRQSFAPALLLLFTPGSFHILEKAWIEPYLLLFVAATVFLVSRHLWTFAAVAIGLLLSSKQYVPFILPAIGLLIPRPLSGKRVIPWAVIVCATGLIVTLPFIAWDPHAFFHSLTSVYLGMLRKDSISFLPWLAKFTGHKPTMAVTLAAALPPILFVCWRSPRTPSGFGASAAFILLCIFAFGTQAFGNYYFLCIGCLTAAIVALETTGNDRLRSL